LGHQRRFDLPFVFQGVWEFSSIRPKQALDEIRELFEIVKGLETKYVCEIGTWKGGTFYLWCEAAREEATLIALDYLIGPLLHPFSLRRRLFYRHFRKAPSQKIYFVAGDSHKKETLKTVKTKLHGARLDFLFIDGDHTYDGVKRDFEMYSPLVREGGVIAFHDILPRPDCPSVQVERFWREIKLKYRFREFVANSAEPASRVGIGVIWQKTAPDGQKDS
jgi:predicted O-methyltransferase YrrM